MTTPDPSSWLLSVTEINRLNQISMDDNRTIVLAVDANAVSKAQQVATVRGVITWLRYRAETYGYQGSEGRAIAAMANELEQALKLKERTP